jgi:photosystem II stability/assembly factor-like uncharacterized protein
MLVASVAIEDALNVTLVYSTHDGGRTWRRARFPTSTKINFPLTLDPELAFGDDGAGYYITEINGTGFWSVRTLNGGRSWDPPYLHKYAWNYDRSFAAVGRGRYKGRLFVSGVTMLRWGAKHCGQYETSTSDD